MAARPLSRLGLQGEMMQSHPWKRVAATQFSLYMAIANMGFSVGAALLGPLQGWLGYSPLFFVVACCSLLVAVLLFRFVNVDQHLQRVGDLDVEQNLRDPEPGLSYPSH